MGIGTITYSHAAPYIREAILNAAGRRLAAKTKRDRARCTGEMMGLVHALKVLLASPEGQDSPVGFPKFTGGKFSVVFAEVERFAGGEHEMRALGFTEGEHEHNHEH